MADGPGSNNTAWLQLSQSGSSRTNVRELQAPAKLRFRQYNVSDPTGESIVDYRALTKPIEVQLEVLLLKAVRNYFSRQGEIQELGPVEIRPGLKITTDADLAKFVRDTVVWTQYHPVGTCATMPLELGGVVDKDLLVHGIEQLSIVDASIIPLLVGATLQASVYAVAEKVRTV